MPCLPKLLTLGTPEDMFLNVQFDGAICNEPRSGALAKSFRNLRQDHWTITSVTFKALPFRLTLRCTTRHF